MWKSLKFSTQVQAAEFRSWSAIRLIAEAFVLVLGLLSVLCDLHVIPYGGGPLVHRLFGVALLCLTSAELLALRRTAEGDGSEALYQRSRRLARRIYFLLYAMAALRVSVFLADRLASLNCISSCGSAPSAQSMDDFLVYIGFGVTAIALIRVITVLGRLPGKPAEVPIDSGQRVPLRSS